jgi:molecular chaperone HscB
MNTAQEVQCWRCGGRHEVSLFCSACQAIQLLPPQADYFAALDLPRNLMLDESEITQRYYDLSRRLHPDLYQTGTPQEKEASLKNTALLTHAYRTLRDPVQRGQYWLELHGEQLGKENNRVPPQLAALVFEVQEKLAEFREAGEAGKTSEAHAELAAIRDDLNAQLAQLLNGLRANFAQWRSGGAQPELLRALKNVLAEIAYLRTLLRDVEKGSDASWNA